MFKLTESENEMLTSLMETTEVDASSHEPEFKYDCGSQCTGKCGGTCQAACQSSCTGMLF